MGSRRFRLFGLRDVRLSGETPVIYARRFDGINDYMYFGSELVLTGVGSIKFKGVINQTVARLFSDAAGVDQFRSLNSTNERLIIAGTVTNSATSFFADSFGVSVEWELKRVGSTMHYIRDGVTLQSLPCSAANTEIVYFATRAALDAFFEIPVLEYIEVDGVRVDESNNWGGATIFGATLIESSDGGVTWSVV